MNGKSMNNFGAIIKGHFADVKYFFSQRVKIFLDKTDNFC